MSEIVHIARNGKPLGQYRSDQIKNLLEQGTLRQTDMFFDETSHAWREMSWWTSSDEGILSANPAVQEGGETEVEEDESVRPARRRRSSRRSRDFKKPRKRNPSQSALPGWIAALFAIGIAAGLWAWAQNLSDQLASARKKNIELEESVAALRQHVAVLNEIAPMGKIRGVITLEPQIGQLMVMGGVSVALYRLDDLRSAIMRVANLPTPATEEEFSNLLTRFQASLPSPLSVTLTNSNGRFELTTPEAGRYGIVATSFRMDGGTANRMLWLMEFDSGISPTPILSLSENNAISLSEPFLRITPARR